MADVLVVPALQLGHPVPFVVLVKARDRTLHRNPPALLGPCTALPGDDIILVGKHLTAESALCGEILPGQDNIGRLECFPRSVASILE
jgi:hypothetical protein